MILHPNEERMVSQFHRLHQCTIRACTADDQALVGQALAEVVVELIAVTVTLSDDPLAVVGFA